MDENKILEMQKLIHEKLSSYTTAVLHNEGGKCIHVEIKLSFRKEYEIDNAIKALQKLHI